MTWEEANEITERMELPYARIWFCGEGYSRNFNKRYKLEEVILSKKSSKESEEQTKIIKSGHAIGVIYKNKKNNKLRYIEIILSKNHI